ncbi:hypothetical protein C8Q70DRAFT_562953 [Cubamyces menziesii]|nr:hypothetical protein C8Q70DRAFT_562953 [Cubamyces menziesii]
MSKKTSPNRRRSIAAPGHGPAKTSSRRRAYSIAPGERLSPAAKARRLLAPRKSILKDDSGNMTQTMDLTEVHGQGPRKSLLRRVSFASHTQNMTRTRFPGHRNPNDVFRSVADLLVFTANLASVRWTWTWTILRLYHSTSCLRTELWPTAQL